MPRANRYFVPGNIWHITHRCHNRQFLFQKYEDRNTWFKWLSETQQRYNIPILGYTTTCNHVHLLVQDPGLHGVIPKAMQLVQSQTAQEFNYKYQRTNAFWGDRYHATAVESGIHLLRCLIYIDLNMTRAGAVDNPADWPECSYHEIQMNRPNYSFVNKNRLAMLLGVTDVDSLRKIHLQAIQEQLSNGHLKRDERWTESIAIGSESFINTFAQSLGKRLRTRIISESKTDGQFLLREDVQNYGLGHSEALAGENTLEWRL